MENPVSRMNPHHNQKSSTTSSALCLLCDSQNPCIQLSHDLRDKWSYNLCFLFNDIDLITVRKSIENAHYCLDCQTELRKIDKIYDTIQKLQRKLQIIKSKHKKKLRDLIKKSFPVPNPLIPVDLSSENSSENSGDENYDDVESTVDLDEETTEQQYLDSVKSSSSGGISFDGIAEDSSSIVPKDEMNPDPANEADNGENPILFVNTNSGMSSSRGVCFSEDIETVTVIVQPDDYEDQHSNPVVEDGGNQSEEIVYAQLRQRYGLREFSILVERLPANEVNQTGAGAGKGATVVPARSKELKNRKLRELYAVKYTPSDDEKIPVNARQRRLMHYMCKVCGKKFNWLNSLISHLSTHAELQLEQIRCSTCDRLFTNRQNCAAHEAKYKGECNFKCDYCDYSCITQNEFTAHKTLHPPDAPFRCNIGSCDDTFQFKTNLEEHKRSIHARKPNQGGSRFDFVCEICGKSLSSEQNLRIHQTIHGGDSSTRYLGLKLNFICDICGKHFKYKGSFEEHRTTHPELNLRQNRCTICDKLFTSSRNLDIHMAKHKGVFKFKCDQCDYGCTSITQLKSHANVHTSVRPFSCDNCPEKFKSKSYLRSHLKFKHSGGACAVECTICGLKLSCKLGLQRHTQRVHGTEKAFSCELCGESFVVKNYLTKHLKRSHENGKPVKGITKKARLKMLSKDQTASEENATSV